MKFHSNSAEDTFNLGSSLAKLLRGGETIALFGNLGLGKTVFVKGLASALGYTDVVTSPTFTILNQYQAKFLINHYDMYRITTIEDLYATAFFDYVGDNSCINVIEWSENIEEYLPKDSIYVRINHTGEENERIIEIKEIKGLSIDYENIGT